MVLNVHRNHKRLIRGGEKGGRGYGGGWGEKEIIYLSLHCHHQNDFCIKVGSDKSHFNVCINCEGQSHKSVSTDHNFWRERRAEADSNRCPSAYQPNALPLGPTDLLKIALVKCCLMSSDVTWHIRDKLWPMPKHGLIIFYVHGNQKAR